MGRNIIVSTPVFAAIWRQRQDGEETEDAILARLLKVSNLDQDSQEIERPGAVNGGVYDSRNGVHFPRGFRAFRRYKRRDYEAIAGDGVWIRQDTGQTYATLNQLNDSIAAGPENVWNGNWKFHAADGTVQPLDALRRAA
jgi:hypothetical protein